MDLIPVILDDTLPIEAPPRGSVLALPLATGCVLDYLAAELAGLSHGSPLVVSEAADPDAWRRRTHARTLERVRFVRPASLAEMLHTFEASDYLLVVQPRYWPVAGYGLAELVDGSAGYQGATHAIAVGTSGAGPRERVECDGAGQVRRVQRLYDPIAWPGSTTHAVFGSIVPARAACDIAFRTLSQLRAGLLEKGLFTQDVPVATDLADLARAADALSVGERTLNQAVCRAHDCGYSLHAPGVLIGQQCAIDESARLIAPVILQPGTCVQERAVIVGPTTIGPDCTVGRQAVVAQSILAAGACVPAGQTVCQQVLWDGKDGGPSLDATRGPAALMEMPTIAGMLDATAAEKQAPTRASRRWASALKRLQDVVLSLLGLIVLAPFLAAVAVLVKLTSPGPVFFIHRREGRGGREFGCIKFRTMVADAHSKQRELYKQNQVDGPQFKMDNDPRITRIGQWLRGTNIDELPQLLNVLAGQMSLVGPRPSPFRENQICVPWRRARLSVRPGITGMWQICRDRRSDGDFHQWIFYDLAYVRHFSLWLDARILFYTLASKGGRRRVPLAKLVKIAEAEDSFLPSALPQKQA